MSKAILSLFCVAVLYSSGLVLAKPQAGDTVKKLSDKGGDLANKAIEGLAAGYDPNSLEAQGIGLAGDLVNGLVDGLGGLAGSAINSAQTAGKKAGDLANAGYDAAKAGLNKATDTAISENDQLLAAAGDVLDNLIDLGENAKVLKRLTQSINN